MTDKAREALAQQIEAIPRPGHDRCWRPRDAFDAGFRAGIGDAAKLVRTQGDEAVQPSHAALLQEWLDYEGTSAGFTRELLADKIAFAEFIAAVEARRDSLVIRTIDALAETQPLPDKPSAIDTLAALSASQGAKT